VEEEKMTEKLRTTLADQLANSRFFLSIVRAVPEPDKKATNADKISKVRARAVEIKRDLNIMEQELAMTENAARARGKIAEIVRKAEKAAEEISRLQNGRDDWPQRFKTFLVRAKEVATVQEVELDEPTLEKMKQKLVELAKQKSEIDDLDGELEAIIIDSI